MSFFRHREIFPNDPGATLSDYAGAHRPDESPVGYSSAGCSPASPASALPTGSQCALNSSCWSTNFHRTANCVLTVCLTPGGRPKSKLPNSSWISRNVRALRTAASIFSRLRMISEFNRSFSIRRAEYRATFSGSNPLKARLQPSRFTRLFAAAMARRSKEAIRRASASTKPSSSASGSALQLYT
jgi:hypothetical protein